MVISMRLNPTMTGRTVLASLIGLLLFACLTDSRAAERVRQPVAVRFSYDRPINAVAAPFVLAATDGLFGSEGLAVTTDIAGGSPEAIARVAAGATDFALVDINALIRFRGSPTAALVKAVFI